MKWLRFILVLILGFGAFSLQSQVIKGKKVSFHLNNAIAPDDRFTSDSQGPVISIISPQLENGIYYVSKDQKLVVIGNISDESSTSIFTINSEMILINNEGGFSYTIDLETGQNDLRLVAYDNNNNITEKQVYISYEPELTLAEKINENSIYYALVIGINKYDDNELKDLHQPIKDCELFIEAITKNYTFEEENITFLKNATRDDIITSLDNLSEKVSHNDNLLIFYAGHGGWDEDSNNGHWLPSDAKEGRKSNWIRNSALVDYLAEINSKHTLLIADACFGGAIFDTRSGFTENFEAGIDLLYERPSRIAMTSGNKTVVPDKSAFAKYMIQRLNSNQEKFLTSLELFTSFRNAVSSNSDAIPQHGDIRNTGHEGGDFIFLKRD